MYLKYGSYSHAANEAEIGITRTPLFNDGGQQWGCKETWRITGLLLGTSASDINTKCAALKAAYIDSGYSLGLYFDDGTLTNHAMDSNLTRGGLRVIEGVSFPVGDGTEGATQRTYSIVVEGEFPDTTIIGVSWSETLSFEGGGPLYTHLQTLNGLPQKQLLCEATPYRVTQEGEAVGQFNYPLPAGPLWPGALKQAPSIRKRNPRRFGPLGNASYYEFPITWQYVFESATPLGGNPSRWLN